MNIRVDNARLRDLSPFGWVMLLTGAGFLTFGVVKIGAALGTLSLGPLGPAAVSVLAGAVLLGAADSDATPEFDGKCAACGTAITVNSGRASTDRYVRVRETREPRRLTIDQFSVIISRNKVEAAFCSPKCAEHQLDTPGGLVGDQAEHPSETWTEVGEA